MSRALQVGLVGCALVGCAPGATPGDAERTGAARGAVIGGAPDAGDPAIVMLAAWPADLSSLDLCTATLIAPDVLLTAAHCVDPQTHVGYSFGVFVGPDANAYPTASTLIPKLLPIDKRKVHPDYDRNAPFTADIAVVTLPAPLAAAPLPIGRAPLDAAAVGAPARIVGYGQIQYEQPNAKKFSADTTLAALDDGDTVTVGDLDHRTCIGDSGGPALMVVDGVETVVGVNSYTDLAGCLQPAHYRRTDLYTAFLAPYAPAPPGTGGGGGAGATGGAGGAATGGAPSEGGAAGADAEEEDGCGVSKPRSGGAGGLGSLALLVGFALRARACSRSRRR